MEDERIVELYWQRNEKAISETENKYGPYLFKIAHNILADREDSLESVNDTYLKAWESMPPNKPNRLPTYLGRLTRFVAIDRVRRKTSLKRQSSQYPFALSELKELEQGSNITEETVDGNLLAEAISAFLKGLPELDKNIFVGRYYFLDSINNIAGYAGISGSNVKIRLHRIRLELKEYLKKEGFVI